MGKAYNYLNDNQRDALLSYYYNLVPKTFRGKMIKYRNALIDAQTEQEYKKILINLYIPNKNHTSEIDSVLINESLTQKNLFLQYSPIFTNFIEK